MKYSPGSFTKNFAWHARGFSKLHRAIGIAFPGLVSIPVADWITDRSGQLSAVGDLASNDQRLVPPRFFLHSRDDRLSVDELIYQAYIAPHSRRFDCLCLFAFHLNRCGPSAAVERPAMWANSFVREVLWRSGGWTAEALEEGNLQSALDSRIDAVTKTRNKCRTNYHYFFRLAGYLPTESKFINTFAEDWLVSALFLAWDRCLLDDRVTLNRRQLLSYAYEEELYKLAGVSEEFFEELASGAVDLYIKVNGMDRFSTSPSDGFKTVVYDTDVEKLEINSDKMSWLIREQSDETIERHERLRSEQLRDRKLASDLKAFYENRCCICGKALQVGVDPEVYYSEASHIRPLGKPHDGPDHAGNIAILCRDHHLQFDRGLLRLQKKEGCKRTFVVESKIRSDPVHGKEIQMKHDLDESCVAYHYNWFDGDTG